MRVLAIETSHRIGSLAAIEHDDHSSTLVGTLDLPGQQRSACSLVPTMKTLLDQCDWPVGQLDLICVVTGPGSFTGLRIGVTAAKSLAYATQAKVAQVHTLAAIAFGIASPTKRLWTVLDAQRQELFVAKFDDLQNNPVGVLPETTIMSVDDWLSELQDGDMVAGPPMAKLKNRLPGGIVLADPKDWMPKPEVVGKVGIENYRAGHTVDLMQLVPNYYRKSAAEEKADAKR